MLNLGLRLRVLAITHILYQLLGIRARPASSLTVSDRSFNQTKAPPSASPHGLGELQSQVP